MSETVTMFGEELTFVPFDEETRVSSYWGNAREDDETLIGVSEMCAGRWSGYVEGLASYDIEAHGPQDAATQFEQIIADAALRLPADVWARMVARRRETRDE